MKYIWCEDKGSGYYFWCMINQVYLENRFIVESQNGITNLVKEVNDVKGNANQYLICFDRSSDNKELKHFIAELINIEKNYENIVLINYICFEQMVLSSKEIGKFIPNIQKDVRYDVIQQHINHDYRDVEYLTQLLHLNNIKYGTLERFFRPVLEENAIFKEDYEIRMINGRQSKFINRIMYHHFIYKGELSKCWYTDCIEECPQKYCWKSEQECKECLDKIYNESCKKSEVYNNIRRKYTENIECSKELPMELKNRIKLLFDTSILMEIIR